MNTVDLTKLAKKRQYKLRGVFLSLECITDYIGKVFISKGTGTKKKIYVFTVLGKVMSEFRNLSPKYRVKVWFTIKCKEYKGNWFTELIIESYEHWKVNEDKLLAQAKQLKLIQENQYSKSLYNNNGNS